MLNHRHYDFFLYGVSVAKQKKDADIIGEGVYSGIGDADITNTLMSFCLLSHKLLTGCEQLFTIVGRQRVGSYPTIKKLLIIPSHKMVVVSFCCLGSQILGRSLRGTPHQAYQTYYTCY